jgi:hypothetical protein
MGDTSRDPKRGESCIVLPEGGSPIRTSHASSMAQYASKFGRRVDKAAVEADVGVSRLSLVAWGEVMGCFFPSFL